MADTDYASHSGGRYAGFTALPTGTRVDRYEIESLIAAGGFGVTYVARHTGLDKRVALKEHFPRDFAARDGVSLSLTPTNPETFEWTKERFLREGKTLTECRHPSVVEVTDVFEANGTAYMALEYVEGDSLGQWLKNLKRAPSQAEIDAILEPLLDALAYVHSRDLLHRDIAPDNVIIRPNGRPVLIDFGAARQAVAQRSMMMSAIVKGGYSPPEQYTSKGQTQGPWSDIYALGATLHVMLTGQSIEESTARTAEDSYRPLAEALGPRAGDYRPGFLAAIDQSLRLARLERPQSIAALREKMFAAAPAPLGASLSTMATIKLETLATPNLSSSGKPLQAAHPEDPSSSAHRGGMGPRAALRLPEDDKKKSRASIIAVSLVALLLAGGAAAWQQGWLAGVMPIDPEVRKAAAAARAAEAATKVTRDKAENDRSRSPTSVTAKDAVPFDPALSVTPGSGQSFRDRLADGSACTFCPDMVVAPAGSFAMGSPDNEPERRVTFAKPFAAGQFSVTFDQWDACVADGGCMHKPEDRGWGRGDRPVINVNWDDSKRFTAWLSKKTGKPYRLLSEAEREYVARAGTTTPFWWGATISATQANYDGRVAYNNGAKGEYRQRTVPVQSFRPNPWGLYQVHGNVWEWVEDCYAGSYQGAPTDGSKAPETANCSRVVRGGSWLDNPQGLRSADRFWYSAVDRYGYIGFRVARSVG